MTTKKVEARNFYQMGWSELKLNCGQNRFKSRQIYFLKNLQNGGLGGWSKIDAKKMIVNMMRIKEGDFLFFFLIFAENAKFHYQLVLHNNI